MKGLVGRWWKDQSKVMCVRTDGMFHSILTGIKVDVKVPLYGCKNLNKDRHNMLHFVNQSAVIDAYYSMVNSLKHANLPMPIHRGNSCKC